MTVLWSIFGFIVVMGVVVSLHEWGHYQVARWFNIKVLTFSIGFGKTLYQKQGKETCFKIGLFPLGGFVKFVDEREGTVAEEDLPRAFNRQNVYKRFAVVVAGPIVNLLLAWFIFALMYMIGINGSKPVFNQVSEQSPLAVSIAKSTSLNNQAWSVLAVDHQPVSSWQMVHEIILSALVRQKAVVDMTIESLTSQQRIQLTDISLNALDLNAPKQNWLRTLGFEPFQPLLPVVVGEVVSDGPADKGGLRYKDTILEVAGQPVSDWLTFVNVVQSHPGELVRVSYKREGSHYRTDILLEQVPLQDGRLIGRMGVGVDVPKKIIAMYTSTVQYGPIDAFKHGYQRSVDLFGISLVMLQRMFFGDVSLENLSGPLSIAQFSGKALQTGLISFLSLLGLISLSIGLLNLLPIPVLDGGHLLYYLVEMVKGSPVSEQVMAVGQTIGFVLIVGLMFVALFNDVVRISHG
ncbi:RIP metalloprotease RseP [Thiomicrorhabdus arctica]|uniref:RIP metalloprotease RseP n=1 Tax=Thiomicrorhabdus arctica TaxID=131540 RepID=UPI000379BA92|nr:RIP metalloprotease RseP [Thiomicrorhabdus arctica]